MLALLTSFDDTRVELGVTEMAASLGVHKSTASRLAGVLERAGLLTRSGRRAAARGRSMSARQGAPKMREHLRCIDGRWRGGRGGVADATSPSSGCGGHRGACFPTRLYAEPTVLDGVTHGMAIEREETFGPVAPVVEVRSAAEALELTNAAPFGLTAAVFTADLERGLAFAERARAGWVNINASTNLWESHLPFGGRAGVSGTGRVGGSHPMDTFTEPKTVTFPAPTLLPRSVDPRGHRS